MKISLEVTNPKTYSEGGSPELKTAIFLANENNGEARVLSENKGKFGDVDPENPNDFTLFTFELTNKEDFILLGEETKIKVIVDTEDQSGNAGQNLAVSNPYSIAKAVKFEYSKPIIVDLIPLDWKVGDTTVALAKEELDEYKKRLEESMRAIMPITISDGTPKNYLTVHVTDDGQSQLLHHDQKTRFPRLIKEKLVTPGITSNAPEFDGENGLLSHSFQKLGEVNGLPYSPELLSEKIAEYEAIQLILIKYNQTLSADPYGRVLASGNSFFGDNMAVAYYYGPNSIVTPFVNYPAHTDIGTAIHEIGHLLGSAHAPAAFAGNTESLIGLPLIDEHWYSQLHFEGSPYYLGRTGVVGNNFILADAESGDNSINARWIESSVEFIKNTAIDIMGQALIGIKWLSDRNFEQWFRTLNSVSVDKKYKNRQDMIDSIQ
ncbi:MAG: hypothetical protein FWG02_10975 [Holophagaceae bacterium]|nr:hypothetical protein [Holophagaceae bacterium]